MFEEKLVAPFSYKYAAVNAGLGWIGKNDVVVTERYGPRIRLSAVLIDHEFVYGQKIVESKCPATCKNVLIFVRIMHSTMLHGILIH